MKGFQKGGGDRWLNPKAFVLSEVEPATLQQAFKAAKGPQILEIPDATGALVRFEVEEYSMMEPGLAAQFPEIRTFRGTAVGDPLTTVYGDWTPQGFHASVQGPGGSWYVDPYEKGNSRLHVSYLRRDLNRADAWRCGVLGDNPIKMIKPKGESGKDAFGTTLRSYRLAVAATGEYTTFHGGTAALGQAAIVTAINRVNQIYERDLCVRLILVAGNINLVYTNSATDPYTNNSASNLLSENQSNVDTVIGSTNYDVGHVFSTAGGGLAGLGVVCFNGSKAQGETGLSSPTGDPFYIDYVCHEMGHQFGANHTYAGSGGFCGGNENPSTAVEPGSGSTIMAYAGICGADDLQSLSDAFFHPVSIDEVQTFITSTCASNSATGNTPPTANAGADYVIPVLTPFTLTGSGSDANADTLTYVWDQMDPAVTGPLTNPDNGTGPLFRSLGATTSTQRTFPKLSTIISNGSDNAEKLPAVARNPMRFRFTVRDNRTAGGGVATDDMTLNVVGTAGPFVVTAPNTAVSVSGTVTVTWNVANTNVAPVNTANVNILLSTDGGNTFPTVLKANTPNDGSEQVSLPNLSSTTARIKVEAAGNVYWDMSNANFTVTPWQAGLGKDWSLY